MVPTYQNKESAPIQHNEQFKYRTRKKILASIFHNLHLPATTNILLLQQLTPLSPTRSTHQFNQCLSIALILILTVHQQVDSHTKCLHILITPSPHTAAPNLTLALDQKLNLADKLALLR